MDELDPLRRDVLRANLDLVVHGLVQFTWGNASGVDRARDLMVIKPSGIPYDHLTVDDLVAVRLSTGAVIPVPGQEPRRPSSDTPTHLHLYRAWPGIGGIVHTHSEYATAVAQACCGLPALGTTHADDFHGEIPCTRRLTRSEVAGDYEIETGAVIVACFAQLHRDPLDIPAVLVAQHGPFAWGASPAKALYHAAIVERLARMLVHTRTLSPGVLPIGQDLLDRHYRRKHGPQASYGQPG